MLPTHLHPDWTHQCHAHDLHYRQGRSSLNPSSLAPESPAISVQHPKTPPSCCISMLSMSPTTPGTQGVQLSYANSPTSARGHTFKRPASSDDEAENGEDAGGRPHSRRHAAVKRACNECRQQKVRARDRVASCRPSVHAPLTCLRAAQVQRPAGPLQELWPLREAEPQVRD